MPTDLRRRDDIAAAVAAYDRDHPDAQLPRHAALSRHRVARLPDTYRLHLPPMEQS